MNSKSSSRKNSRLDVEYCAIYIPLTKFDAIHALNVTLEAPIWCIKLNKYETETSFNFFLYAYVYNGMLYLII